MIIRTIGLLLVAAAGLAAGCGQTVTVLGPGCEGDICNPEGCPASAPTASSACAQNGLECDYRQGDCTVTFQCGAPQGQPPPRPGDDGRPAQWQPTDQVCDNVPVPCEQANDLDRCALPGETCSNYGECEYQEKSCGEDGLWHVYWYTDECCYDECCYGNCCEPTYCPAQVPQKDSLCDPCWDGENCSILYETECGLQQTLFWCDWNTSTWQVEDPPPCP